MKHNWIYKVFFITFILSLLFSSITTCLSNSFNNIILVSIILIMVIGVGVIFDMIGTASLTSKPSSFHAMNSKKIEGAKEALFIINNNVKVSSICNDIIGDICGIISGGLGAVLALSITSLTNLNIIISTIIVSAIISSLTVGGKAIFKMVAIRNADKIVFRVARILEIVTFKRV